MRVVPSSNSQMSRGVTVRFSTGVDTMFRAFGLAFVQVCTDLWS